MRRTYLLTVVAAFALITAAPASAGENALKANEAVARVKAAMLVAPSDALIEGERADAVARRIADPSVRRSALATIDWLRGEANLRMDREDLAAPFITRALAEAEKIAPDTKLHGDILLSSGGLHGARTDVAASLIAYQRAFDIFRKIGDLRSQSIALLSLGGLYSNANEHKAALKYFEQAADLYDSDPQLSLSTHNNRGIILTDLGRFVEAERQFLLALAIANKLNSDFGRASILLNSSRLSLKTGKVEVAASLIREGSRIARNGEAEVLQQSFSTASAQLAYQRHLLPDAVRLIEQSFRGVDLATTPLWYRDAHLTAIEIFTKAGDPAAAFAHLTALKRIDDEAARLASSLNTAMVAARFDFANQELRIARLKAEELRHDVEVAQQQARNERILFLSIGGATLLVISLLLFSLITIRRSRDKVRAANGDLAITNAALGKALAAKTEFLATTSHEIRTPLNGILGMTQVMLADAALPPAIRDRVGVVHGAGVTMRALVDDILDMAKIETGAVTVVTAPFDCCALVTDASRLWRDQARAKGLNFTLNLDDCPAIITGDEARVRQIVFNLLSNATKFTESGGVELRATTAADGESFEIAVTDSGVGIAAEQRDLIFEPFRQADAGTTRRFGGTGLGLSICRSLARAMGGDVRVDSEAGGGSTFALTLPLVPAELAMPVEDEVAGPVVLIVERNPIARSMLRALVEPRAARVALAADALDACARLADGRVTHVLVDEATLDASGDAGDELRAIVAAARVGGATVALLWSGREDLANAGADRMIRKPIAGAAMVNALFSPESEEADRGDLLVTQAA